MNREKANTSEALAAFFKETPGYCEPYGNGHINDTFLSSTEPHVILQRINTAVFTDPCAVMENICGVTEHLRKKLSGLGSTVVIEAHRNLGYSLEAGK